MAHLGLIRRDRKPEAIRASRGVRTASGRKSVMKIIEKDK
jgi:hypothetical protein